MQRLSTLAILSVLAWATGCDERSEAGAPSPVARAERRSSLDVDPLPSWNAGAAKGALIAFVGRVTRPDAPDYVPPGERIAVFDNDGTLWVEKPIPTQLAFALARVKELAPEHPEWKTQQPFKAVLDGDLKRLAQSGEPGLMKVLAVTHANMTTEEFTKIVTAWIDTARHPRFHRLYTKLAYLPQLELLTYLRSNGFSTYIVSGGGVEFMRPWSDRVYGIAAHQVIGSRIELQYEVRDGTPVLYRLPAIELVDNKAGKPVGIQQVIGRRPILAFGNSDGDFEMLQWTTAGPGPRLGLLVHHTDAVREYAYDRDSEIGRLSKALDAAPANHWIVVDMKRDWRQVFQSP